MRSSEEEKLMQINAVRNFQALHASEAETAMKQLRDVARARQNTFEELMESVKYLSLGQISGALYTVGGEYRRNM
jgi:methylmalonyl-CoA mutase